MGQLLRPGFPRAVPSLLPGLEKRTPRDNVASERDPQRLTSVERLSGPTEPGVSRLQASGPGSNPREGWGQPHTGSCLCSLSRTPENIPQRLSKRTCR